MSDVHNYHNLYPKCDEYDHRIVIKENWIVDDYGFVDVDYYIESCVRHGVRKTLDVLNRTRPFCTYCKVPTESHNIESQDDQ